MVDSLSVAKKYGNADVPPDVVVDVGLCPISIEPNKLDVSALWNVDNVEIWVGGITDALLLTHRCMSPLKSKKSLCGSRIF